MPQNEKVRRMIDLIGEDLAGLHLDGQLEFVRETLSVMSESIAEMAKTARSASFSSGRLLESISSE